LKNWLSHIFLQYSDIYIHTHTKFQIKNCKNLKLLSCVFLKKMSKVWQQFGWCYTLHSYDLICCINQRIFVSFKSDSNLTCSPSKLYVEQPMLHFTRTTWSTRLQTYEIDNAAELYIIYANEIITSRVVFLLNTCPGIIRYPNLSNSYRAVYAPAGTKAIITLR